MESVNLLAPLACPACNYKLDAVTATQGRTTAPRQGDLGICFGCGRAHSFTEGGVALLDPHDRARLPIELRLELDRVQAGWRRFQSWRRATN